MSGNRSLRDGPPTRDPSRSSQKHLTYRDEHSGLERCGQRYRNKKCGDIAKITRQPIVHAQSRNLCK